MHYEFKTDGRAGETFELSHATVRDTRAGAVLVRLVMLFVIWASVLPCDNDGLVFRWHVDLL